MLCKESHDKANYRRCPQCLAKESELQTSPRSHYTRERLKQCYLKDESSCQLAENKFKG